MTVEELVPDGLWSEIAPLLSAPPPRPKGGRRRVPYRNVVAGIPGRAGARPGRPTTPAPRAAGRGPERVAGAGLCADAGEPCERAEEGGEDGRGRHPRAAPAPDHPLVPAASARPGAGPGPGRAPGPGPHRDHRGAATTLVADRGAGVDDHGDRPAALCPTPARRGPLAAVLGRPQPPLAPDGRGRTGHHPGPLLAELDADPTGIFWGLSTRHPAGTHHLRPSASTVLKSALRDTVRVICPLPASLGSFTPV
jgi:hypothetical protein